jgi:hypothetical protein
MRKPFNLEELVANAYNYKVVYQNERQLFLNKIPTLIGLEKKLTQIKIEDLERKIKEYDKILDKYKQEIREIKLNKLGIR